MEIRTLEQLDLTHKRVFLRADLNVPLDDHGIRDATRLTALLPTLNFLRIQQCKIVLATHLGRPFAAESHRRDDPLSTAILAAWFNEHGYHTELVADLKKAAVESHRLDGKIVLLENLRFFRGEQEASYAFAQLLATCADRYINDGFSVMHRADASITLLPQLLPQQGCGLLVAQELVHLEHLICHVAQPFVVVVGGNKIADKLPLLKGLLRKPAASRVSKLIIGGSLAFPLRAARGETLLVPISEEDIKLGQKILTLATEQQVSLILPLDDSIVNGSIVDIGPKTVELFLENLAGAHTIFCNGTMGVYETEAGAQGTLKLMRGIAAQSGYRVVGGGNAVDAAHRAGISEKIDFISTGGGATLQFLAAQNPYEELPGLCALRES